MNNYDDIKRFIEKSKTEHFDYKEINEKTMSNGITSSMNKWTLIKQISSSDEPQNTLDNGRSTQPTPQPVTQEEFKNSAPASPKAEIPSQIPARAADAKPVSPEIASSSIVPAAMSILDTLRAALPEPDSSPRAAQQPAPAPQPHSPFAARQPAAAAVQHKETGSPFRHMFKQKAPQPEENTLPRDTPLQPLLEMIASCR